MTLLTKISFSLSQLGKFWQEKTNAVVFRWNLVLITFQFLYLLFRFNDLPPQVPLNFSRPWGELYLANPNHLFMLPIFSLIFWLINNTLSAFLLTRTQLLSRLLVIFSLVFSVLVTVSLVQIINLVI